MGRKKNTSTEQPAADANGTLQGVSKTEAVQAALTELGKDAQPQAIQEYIHQKFGMELEKSLISNYKHTLTKKKGKKRGRKAKAVEAPKVVASMGNGRKTKGLDLQDIETLKDLLSRLNASSLHSLIDLLQK